MEHKTDHSKENLNETVDAEEIRRFDSLAQDWWDPNGPSRILFKLNPIRIAFILDNLVLPSGRPSNRPKTLSGLNLLDVGCGGGILSEPMARLGANVTAIDASAPNIEAAKHHAERMNLEIEYTCTTLEQVRASGRRFEVVLAMEILEHVADKATFIEMLAGTVTSGGSLFLSTLNKTFKAYGLAIIGAERILKLLPRGTHDWSKFTHPSYLVRKLAEHGLRPGPIRGIGYSPLSGAWSLKKDLSINYILHASKPHENL